MSVETAGRPSAGTAPADAAGSLRIHHFISPARVGGAEGVVRALASGVGERGHAVRVSPVIPEESHAHPFVRALRSSGVEVTPLAIGDRAYLREWRSVTRRLRREPPDVVHTHGHRSDLLDATVARRLGIPVVTTVHGFTGSSWRVRLYRHLQHRAYRGFDRVVAVSRPLAREIAASGVDEERIRIIPNAWDGDDDVLPPDEARRELGVDDDAFHVGWVGRLGPEKGADVLLRALAADDAERASAAGTVASFVGDGQEAPALRELAGRLGVGDRVRWLGEVPRARRLFSGFDVFALSSRREGTPLVLFEAMAAGVPIVATKVGGVPDVVSSREALLVPPEEPGALADALRSVRERPDRAQRRAERARERLRRERSPGSWVDRYERLYRDLLPSSRRESR